MNEDEYFEENMPTEEISTNVDVSEPLKEVSSEKKSEEEAMNTSEPAEPDRTEAIFTAVGTSQDSIQRRESSLDESTKDNEESMPGISRRSGGRQKNQRVRKCVIQSTAAAPPTAMDDNVYSEELGGGWARCYSGHKKIAREKAIQQVDSHVLAKLLASASKPAPIKEEHTGRRGKRVESEEPKKKKKAHEDSAASTPSTARISERSASPLKLKSPSRGVSEIPSTSTGHVEPAKSRRMSRDKSETPIVIEKNKEETKGERKERRRREKEEAKEKEKEKEEEERKRRETQERRQKEADEETEQKKKKEKKEKKKEPEAETSKAIDITGWDDERIASHFGLQRLVLVIKNLSQETIDAALAYEPPASRRSRSPKVKPSSGRRTLIDSDSSSSPSPAPSGSQRNGRTSPEVVKQPKEKKRRIEEPVETPESPASPPPPRSPSPENGNANDIRKKSKSIVRKCVGCLKNLHDCVDQWYKTLGAESQYCSGECVEAIVERIKEMESWQGEAKVPMVNATGLIRRDMDAPTVDLLAQYIRQSPAFIPLCLSENAFEWETKEREAKAKATEKASKFMSKESDILRANLKMKIAYELFAHGRLIIKMGMPDCRSKAADMEKELFKVCKSDVNSSKYRFFNEKFKTLFKQYRNFASKIVAGYISPQRLVNLEETELVDFARNNSVNLNEDEAPSADARILQLPQQTEESRAAAQEMAKHLKTAPPPKMGRIPKKPKGQVSTLDSLLGDGMADTTSQHNSHFYDSNCSICAGKAKEKAEKEKREIEEREKFREQERQRKELQKNRYGGGEKASYYEKKRELKRFETKKGEKRREDDEERPLNPSDPLGLNDPVDSPPHNAGYESDNDDYAAGGANDSPPVWQTTPAEAAKAKKPSFDETWRTWRTDDEVWRGQMVMGTITFVTSLKAISNKAAFEMRDSADLPVTLNVKGRIKELVVFEYLNGLRRSESQDVIVLKMEKPLDFEFEKRFMMMYTDMVNKERYQVIDFGDNRRIKDGYLLPIRANQEAPPVLLPWKGPGFPAIHPEMILCVIVRNRLGDPVDPSIEVAKSPAVSGAAITPKEQPEENGQPAHPKSISDLSTEARAILENRRVESPEGEYLINPKFFENIKKSNTEAAPNHTKVHQPPPRIADLAGLLQFINEADNPKVIKNVVSRFLQDPSLDEREREIIHVTLVNRIRAQKGKSGPPPPVSQPGLSDHHVKPVEQPVEAAESAEIPPVTAEEEYDPVHPDESDHEEEGTPPGPPPKPLSPSDFDTERPTSFLNMAGELLSQFAPPPVPPHGKVPTTPTSSNSESNHVTPEKSRQSKGVSGDEFIPPAPQPPPSSTMFSPSIPQIPLPAASNASAELLNIPPPVAPQFNRTPSSGELQAGGIPVLGSESAGQDVSEANSVEAMMGEDSPPDEEEADAGMNHPLYMGPPPMHGGPPMGMPPPMFGGPPTPYMGMPPPQMYNQPHHMGMPPPIGMPPGPMGPPPMGPPHMGHPLMGQPPMGPPQMGLPPGSYGGPPHPMGMPPGHMPYPPQMVPPMMPPPMSYASAPPPKHSVEVHGSAGFKGLAPSLGGKGNNNSIIDFFNSSISTSKSENLGPVPTVVLPAGATLPRGNPFHSQVKADSDDDNIPRTPTPPGPRRMPGARPGAVQPGAARPGVRPGARRILPGARLPPRIPSPDDEELRIMEREERRRLRSFQREEENDKRRPGGIDVNKVRLGKIPKNSPFNVIKCRIDIVARHEGVSFEEAERIVREQHMLASDEEDETGSEAEDLAQTRGIRKVRTVAKRKAGERLPGYAYQHETAFVAVTKQRRAVNVDYDEEGNEIVPDDIPSSDDEEQSNQGPLPKKAPIDRTHIPQFTSQMNKPQSQSEQEPELEEGEVPQFGGPSPSENPSWQQRRPMDYPKRQPPQQKPAAEAPPQDWTRDDYQDNSWSDYQDNNNWNGPSSSFNQQDEQRDYYDDGFGYPPRGPPPRSHPPAGRFPNRGRGQNTQFRGGSGRGQAPPYKLPPNQRGAYGGPPPFRGRGAGPPPARQGPPGATRGHPYYDIAARRGSHPPDRGHGPWTGNRNLGAPPHNGPPPRGHHNGPPRGHPPPNRGHGPPPGKCGPPQPSYFRGGPPPQPPPLAGASFKPPPSAPNGSILPPPPPPPPSQMW